MIIREGFFPIEPLYNGKHRGKPPAIEKGPGFASPCRGRHCAGRVHAHWHRGRRIPVHVPNPLTTGEWGVTR